MTRYYRLLGLLLMSVFFFQCQKEVSYVGSSDILPEVVTPTPLSANLQGNILDETGQPATGVTVTAGSKSAFTDASGYFRIANAPLDAKAAVVTAEKAGYFKGYRVFAATSGTNQLVIKLVKKTLAGTVDATSGGNATLSNGAIVGLPANGVVDAATGNAFSGTINVYANYIDPSSTDIALNVPGSFAATDKNGNLSVLTSYGMIAVELASPSGQKLQIKQGSSATLTMPIPTSVLSSAPSSIPLWFVDEQTGLWKEEGSATKQGNNYVGDVKHFSFWNCDVSSKAVTLSLSLATGKGMPLVHVPVKITRTNSQNSLSATYGYTDSLGKVAGYVPSGEPLLVEVLDPCGNAVYSQNIPSLTQSTDLGVITVPASTTSMLSFSGKLVDCSGNAVTNGFAIIKFNNVSRYAKTDATGNFETTFIVCPGSSSSATVIGVDEKAQQQSTASTVVVTTPSTNAGTITTCGTSSAQYINYTLDGTNYSISSATGDSLMAYFVGQGTSQMLYINGLQRTNTNSYNKIGINITNPTGVGTYPVAYLAVQSYGAPTLTQPFNVTLTSFANALGEFYEGSFSGQFKDSTNPTVHTVSSTFRVRKN